MRKRNEELHNLKWQHFYKYILYITSQKCVLQASFELDTIINVNIKL